MSILTSGSFKSTNVNDGADANLLYLSTSNNVVVFDSDNQPFPNQRITFTAKVQNIDGTIVFRAIPYINDVAQSEIALSGDGNQRYILGSNWDQRWTSLVVTATIGNLTDQTTVYKISEVKGANGQNTIVGVLTNESITLSADELGNVSDFSKATGTYQIYDGIALVNPNQVTYVVQSQTGATANINAQGVYSVTAMSADTATVVFKATYGGVERLKQLSLSKARAGEKGDPGNGIKTSVTEWQRGQSGTVTPSGEWLPSIPDVPPGEFLWSRTTITFDDDTTNVTYNVSRIGEDGRPSYLHTAWANVNEFPEFVPGARPNLLLSSERIHISSNNSSTFPIISTFLGDEDGRTFIRAQRINPTLNPGTLSLFNTIPVAPENLVFNPLGKRVVISAEFRASRNVESTLMSAITSGGVSRNLSKAGSRIQLTTEWQRFSDVVESFPDNATLMRFAPLQILGQTDVANLLIDISNIKLELVEDYESEGTPYIPPITRPLRTEGNIFQGGNARDFIATSGSTVANTHGITVEEWGVTDAVRTTASGGTSITKAIMTALPSGAYLSNGYDWFMHKILIKNNSTTEIVSVTANGSPVSQSVNQIPPGFSGIAHVPIYNPASPTSINTQFRTQAVGGSIDVTWSSLEIIPYSTKHDFTEIEPETDVIYTGTYSDHNEKPSGNPADYTWVRTKGDQGQPGEDGEDGKDGIGVSSTETTYSSSTDGNTPPTSGWQATIPTVPPGQYLWTKILWTYTDASTKTAYTVGKMGENGSDGEDGLPGKDGVGIENTTIEYAVSSDGQNQPSTGWQTTVPNVPQGQFLWTKITWEYTDGTSETGFAVARYGQDGQDGEDGQDGVSVQSIVSTYQAGTSGTTPPTGTWLTSPPTVAENQFLWTKIEITLSDGSKSSGYSVGKMGAQGQPGAPGEPGAPGTPGNGIKSSSVTYQASTSGTTTPTGTWLASPPAVPKGQFLWTRTILTFDNNQSVTAYAVSQSGIDGENGLSSDNMIFNGRFEKFNEWPQSSMGWLKTQFTQAIQPETDKPLNNILRIGGDATASSRYTYSRNIAVVPGTTIELSFDTKISRLFTSKSMGIVRMYDAEHANSSNQADTVGGNSYINLFTDGTASAGAGVGEYEVNNPSMANANEWYRYKVRFVIPENVTNVKLFFVVSDNNASSYLFARDPQGVIYKDLNANTRNFLLDSRFPKAMPIGGTSNNKRTPLKLSRPTADGEAYTIAFNYTLVDGTMADKIKVAFTNNDGTTEYGTTEIDTIGNNGRIVGSLTATGQATNLQIYHGKADASPTANFYEFEKIMLNLGDKTFDYEQAPEDGFTTTNLWPNSSWNLGQGNWVWTNGQYEILPAENDKPQSPILHGIGFASSTQQASQMPHPRYVNVGEIVHISFDYREINRTTNSSMAIVRIFPERDTENTVSNAMWSKVINPTVLGLPVQTINNFTRIDYVFRATVAGWLDFIPADDSNSGNHESFYREIFVSNSGRLHGDWNPAQVDFSTQIEGIPHIFTQSTEPTGEDLKNGDQWWVMSNNQIIGFKVYGNGQWNDQTIDQAIINIVQLNAVNINGSVINGSEFVNQFDFADSSHSRSVGTTRIKDGAITQDAQYISSGDPNVTPGTKLGESHIEMRYGQIRMQYESYDLVTGEVRSASSSNLVGGQLNMTMFDDLGSFNGTLDARALHNKGWKTLQMGSIFETKESNPPQYKIIYQLDGSKLIKFRGQFGLKSGNMVVGTSYYPFRSDNNINNGTTYMPAEIQPDRTAFGYGATSTADGGRLAVTVARNLLFMPASATSYCSLEALQYIIE